MSTISYREIVRKVHPDLNPHISDPGAKMAEIQRNKNNPSALFSLAVKWGLVEGHTSSNFSGFSASSTTHRSYRTRDYWTTDFSADSSGNVYINTEDEVSFRARRSGRGRTVEFGKVKKVDTVKSGKRKGWYRFYVATPRQVFIIKKPTKESDTTLAKGRCLGTFTSAKVEETWKKWVEIQETKKKYKEETRNQKAESTKEDLGTNRNYAGQDVWVFVRTKSNWFRVTRTAAKSVFYHDYFEGKERRCHFSSVSRVWKK